MNDFQKFCFKPDDFGEIEIIQLHIFNDASLACYGAVAYLLLQNIERRIHCSLVLEKAHPSPVREITIPRLSAAVIAVKPRQFILELEYKLEMVTLWTHSISVLKCIKNKNIHPISINRLLSSSKIRMDRLKTLLSGRLIVCINLFQQPSHQEVFRL